MNLHFEIVPDRLSEELCAAIARFPEGGLQLEVGLQTFNPEVQATISRRQNLERTVKTLGFLRERTRAWIHADLIIGLPGETWESFADGFDRLLALGAQQIQIGVLKRLKGAPIARHCETYGLIFAVQPPYEILQTAQIGFADMQRLRRLARYFDLYYNSGSFPRSLTLLWRTGDSAFAAFMALCDMIWQRTGRTHELPLIKLAEYLYEFLMRAGSAESATIGEAVEQDFRQLRGRRDRLEFLPPRTAPARGEKTPRP